MRFEIYQRGDGTFGFAQWCAVNGVWWDHGHSSGRYHETREDAERAIKKAWGENVTID